MKSAFALAALGLLFVGCGSASKAIGDPCTGADMCEKSLCVAGRCRKAGTNPAKLTSSRVVLMPQDLAIITSGDDDGDTLPESIALGKDTTGRAVMLFRFVSSWREDAEIQSAYFIVETIAGAPLPMTPPTIEIARILSPWSGANVTWGRQPRLGMPEVLGPLRVQSQSPLRLDVTPQVRAWARRDRDDYGIALLARGEDPNGVLASTGVTQGTGPHLEVYLK